MRDTKIYNNYKINKHTKDTKDTMISHPRAKHAPSSTYSTWTAFTGIYPLEHSRMKQVMPPQVGYLITCLSTPQQ